MDKYANVEKVINNINKIDEIYLKAKEYDKITKFGKVELKCSFCGRPLSKVQKLIVHNNIHICEHCVALMNVICEEEVIGYDKIQNKARKK